LGNKIIKERSVMKNLKSPLKTAWGTMTYEEKDRELKRIIKNSKKTVLPYDPITQSYTKPPEWDDDMWEGYVFGYDEDGD
jgi:hypothetical protein